MNKYTVGVILALVIAMGIVLGVSQDRNLAAATQTNTASSHNSLAVATFAGGCFWCVESTFEKLEGVKQAVSGYSGGTTENPTYYDVGAGKTGHTEVVQIHYDPSIISYDALLYYLWREIDPTDGKGQFVDRGSMYRPAVFYENEEERSQIEASLAELKASGRFSKPFAVEVLPLEKFYEAEGYHQDYYKKSPLRYKVYRRGSGRDQYLEKVWGDALKEKYPRAANGELARQYSKPSDAVLKTTLTALQYKVTQEDGTERPFTNAYWDNKDEGIYVDITSGEPLFSSNEKYKSGTGWPSFWQPIDKNYIVEALDFKIGFPRTEVRSKYGDAHLGHVFKDGPAPTGLRYCLNSAALKFIPKAELVVEGYAEFAQLFAEQ